jgi:hypothetical protein
MGSPLDVVVVLPVFRNADTLAVLAEKLCVVLDAIGGGFRLVFVVDASPDASWDIVRALAARDPRICGLRLERQVGQHAAVLAGLALVAARHYVVMDADLQDRPEAIAGMLARAREAGRTVFASRQGRYERWDRMLTSRVFKTFLRLVSGVPEDVGTFFVVDAGVAGSMCRMRVETPQVVVLAHHCSAAFDKVPVTRAPRPEGRSAYSSAARVRAAVRSLRCTFQCRRSGAGNAQPSAWATPLVSERVNL